MVTLTNDLFIAQGKQRSCYCHPSEKGLCVKVELKDTTSSRKQVQAEINALQRIKKRHSDSPGLSHYHGTIETNLGLGHLFDLVREQDGTVSPTLRACHEQLERDHLISLVQSLRAHCLRYHYLPGDLHPANLVLRDRKELIIIDGLGMVEFAPIYHLSSLLRRIKLARKHRRLWRNLGYPEPPMDTRS